MSPAPTRRHARLPLLATSFALALVGAACAQSVPRPPADGMQPQTITAETGRVVTVWRADDARRRAAGWHPGRLDAAFRQAAGLSTDTLIVATAGEFVGVLGDPARKYRVHSVRKALLSALIGRHAGTGEGRIDLQARLIDLGIDDRPVALTSLQRTATVEHLLRSRSGINHPAASEGGLFNEKIQRLGLGENQPGSIWAYNNWDYNALTTIFEQRTGLPVAEAFAASLARPLGMRDFETSDVSYGHEPKRSEHRAAHFRMSGRDLRRVGELYLSDGRIDGQDLLSPDWIARITRQVSRTGKPGLRWGHGDLWWLPDPDSGLPPGSFWGAGLGRQALFVIPAWDTVIVHQSDTSEVLKRLRPVMRREGGDVEGALITLIRSCLQPGNRHSDFCREHGFIPGRAFDDLIRAIAAARL